MISQEIEPPTVALVMAGGSGNRFGDELPKQFHQVLGRPIICYVLQVLEDHPEIDEIAVVCHKDYIDLVWELAKEFAITKLSWVTQGGSTFQESARFGVNYLSKQLPPESLIPIVIAVQPLLESYIIDDSLRVAKKFGNAIAGSELYYNVAFENGSSQVDIWTDSYLLKAGLRTMNAPWTFRLETLVRIYEDANRLDIGNGPNDYTATTAIDLGHRLYFSIDDSLNRIKITTREDLALFRAYVAASDLGKD